MVRPCYRVRPVLPRKEAALAKGQKKSNKEIRKPKADKPKAAPATRSFLTPPPKKGK